MRRAVGVERQIPNTDSFITRPKSVESQNLNSATLLGIAEYHFLCEIIWKWHFFGKDSKHFFTF